MSGRPRTGRSPKKNAPTLEWQQIEPAKFQQCRVAAQLPQRSRGGKLTDVLYGSCPMTFFILLLSIFIVASSSDLVIVSK